MRFICVLSTCKIKQNNAILKNLKLFLKTTTNYTKTVKHVMFNVIISGEIWLLNNGYKSKKIPSL